MRKIGLTIALILAPIAVNLYAAEIETNKFSGRIVELRVGHSLTLDTKTNKYLTFDLPSDLTKIQTPKGEIAISSELKGRSVVVNCARVDDKWKVEAIKIVYDVPPLEGPDFPPPPRTNQPKKGL